MCPTNRIGNLTLLIRSCKNKTDFTNECLDIQKIWQQKTKRKTQEKKSKAATHILLHEINSKPTTPILHMSTQNRTCKKPAKTMKLKNETRFTAVISRTASSYGIEGQAC